MNPKKLNLTIDLPSFDETNILEAIKELDLRRPYEKELLTVEDLVTQLLEDVCCVLERPGSWEGSGMENHLRNHGIFDFDHDESHLTKPTDREL